MVGCQPKSHGTTISSGADCLRYRSGQDFRSISQYRLIDLSPNIFPCYLFTWNIHDAWWCNDQTTFSSRAFSSSVIWSQVLQSRIFSAPCPCTTLWNINVAFRYWHLQCSAAMPLRCDGLFRWQTHKHTVIMTYLHMFTFAGGVFSADEVDDDGTAFTGVLLTLSSDDTSRLFWHKTLHKTP